MPAVHRFALLTLAGLGVLAAAEPKKPNVVIIVADDLGWNDVGFRNREVKTPNLDRLVADGVRLDRHYSYPICSCTRAALMTGMSTSRTGVNNGTGLDLSWRIMPETFREAGYQTWMCGKWHLGGPEDNARKGPAFLPHARGFDHFYGHLHGAVDYVTHIRKDTGKTDWQRNGKTVEEEGFSTNLLADEAVKLIKQRDKGMPSLLYLAFNAVHGPLNAPRGSNVDRRERRSLMLANITLMDAAIGRVLKAIDDEKMRDNTIVLFISDNGGQLSNGASNEPWRGEKGTVFEGGIHTVGAIRWPGQLKAGSTSKQVISVIDWLPTLASAAGVKPITGTQPFDGRDLWVNLKGNKLVPPENLVIAQGGYAVFHGPWKLVVGSDQRGKGEKGGGKGAGKQGGEKGKAAKGAMVDGKAGKRAGGKGEEGAADRESDPGPYLFRIDEDPREKTNLARQHPDVVRDLMARGQAMTGLSPGKRKGKA